MGIITELKNSIRKSIHELDSEVNFNFEKILTVTYPYVFFHIIEHNITPHIDPTRNSLAKFFCELVYVKCDDPAIEDLWEYEEIFRKATTNFPFLGTKISALDPKFEIVDEALQMRFNLQFPVKEIDETEPMKEINLTITEA